MSHRTSDLPPTSGIAHVIRELRYHELSRQLLAIVLIGVFTFVARPSMTLVYIGLPLALIGMLVRLHASGFVIKNKELATSGPYALMRHPLYSGNILLVSGFALASSRWWPLPLALAFFWFYYPTAIEYEDRKLHRLFGTQWEAWSRSTPALLPNFGNSARLFIGSWSFAKSTRHNGEIFIAAFAVACMIWIAARASAT